MANETYIIDIGEQGSEGLGRLDYCFNPTTKEFLMNAGLKKGMTVLDIGCGSGVMTCWMAEQVGDAGKVIGIENDQNQLNAAKRNAEKRQINNTEFVLCSAYDIDSLNYTFDLVYCRFVLHHLHDPRTIINKIFNILKSGGIYASEEGIVNFAFSYPFSPAWGDEALRVSPIWIDAPADQRDGNIGVKMFNKMQTGGFTILITKIIHPVLTTKKEKGLLMLGRDEMKRGFIEQGHTEAEWIEQGKQTQQIVDNDNQIVGFYASSQVAGVKPINLT